MFVGKGDKTESIALEPENEASTSPSDSFSTFDIPLANYLNSSHFKVFFISFFDHSLFSFQILFLLFLNLIFLFVLKRFCRHWLMKLRSTKNWNQTKNLIGYNKELFWINLNFLLQCYPKIKPKIVRKQRDLKRKKRERRRINIKLQTK